MLLKDKVALIAGSDDAVGTATAWAMVRAGAKVVLVCSENDKGVNLVRAIRAKGGQAIYQVVNVTMSEQLDILFDRLNREHGRLDIAFNNIAVESQPGLLNELEPGDIAETIDVNVFGTWQVMKYEIEQMLTNPGGVIINNCGVLGINPLPTKSIESATKSAIASMTKAAAPEYARYGIRINAVAPGFIKSDRQANNHQPGINLDLVPMGRLGKPEEVAKAVVWLSSDEASFTTGHLFAIDGGYL